MVNGRPVGRAFAQGLQFGRELRAQDKQETQIAGERKFARQQRQISKVQKQQIAELASEQQVLMGREATLGAAAAQRSEIQRRQMLTDIEQGRLAEALRQQRQFFREQRFPGTTRAIKAIQQFPESPAGQRTRAVAGGAARGALKAAGLGLRAGAGVLKQAFRRPEFPRQQRIQAIQTDDGRGAPRRKFGNLFQSPLPRNVDPNKRSIGGLLRRNTPGKSFGSLFQTRPGARTVGGLFQARQGQRSLSSLFDARPGQKSLGSLFQARGNQRTIGSLVTGR